MVRDQTTPGLLDTPLGLPGIQIAGLDPLTTKQRDLGNKWLALPRHLLRVQEISL